MTEERTFPSDLPPRYIDEKAFDGEIIYRWFHEDSGTKSDYNEGFTAGSCTAFRKQVPGKALYLDERLIEGHAARHYDRLNRKGTPLISFSII